MKEIKCFYDYWHLNYVEDVPYTTLIYTDIYIYICINQYIHGHEGSNTRPQDDTVPHRSISLSLNDDDPNVSWMIHFFVLDSPIFTHTRAHALTRYACFPHFFYIKL